MSVRELSKGDQVVLLGYRGDGVARDVIVDDMKDNRVIVWDRNRKEYRSYLFDYVAGVMEVKQ